jgi:hypothetical protein
MKFAPKLIPPKSLLEPTVVVIGVLFLILSV